MEVTEVTRRIKSILTLVGSTVENQIWLGIVQLTLRKHQPLTSILSSSR